MFVTEHQCSQCSSHFQGHMFLRTVLCPRKPTLSIHFPDGIYYVFLHSTLSKLLFLLRASVWNCNACLKDFDPKGGKPQGSLEIPVWFCVGGDFINSAVFLNFLFSCASRNGCSTCPQSEIGDSPLYFGDSLELKRKNQPGVF